MADVAEAKHDCSVIFHVILFWPTEPTIYPCKFVEGCRARKKKVIAWKRGTSFMFVGEGKVGEPLTSEGMILAYR